jgi:hypothetical protein
MFDQWQPGMDVALLLPCEVPEYQHGVLVQVDRDLERWRTYGAEPLLRLPASTLHPAIGIACFPSVVLGMHERIQFDLRTGRTLDGRGLIIEPWTERHDQVNRAAARVNLPKQEIARILANARSQIQALLSYSDIDHSVVKDWLEKNP